MEWETSDIGNKDHHKGEEMSDGKIDLQKFMRVMLESQWEKEFHEAHFVIKLNFPDFETWLEKYLEDKK